MCVSRIKWCLSFEGGLFYLASCPVGSSVRQHFLPSSMLLHVYITFSAIRFPVVNSWVASSVAVVNSAALSMGRWYVLSPCCHFFWVCALRWDYCVRHHLTLYFIIWLSILFFETGSLLQPKVKHKVRSHSEKKSSRALTKVLRPFWRREE